MPQVEHYEALGILGAKGRLAPDPRGGGAYMPVTFTEATPAFTETHFYRSDTHLVQKVFKRDFGILTQTFTRLPPGPRGRSSVVLRVHGIPTLFPVFHVCSPLIPQWEHVGSKPRVLT